MYDALNVICFLIFTSPIWGIILYVLWILVTGVWHGAGSADWRDNPRYNRRQW